MARSRTARALFALLVSAAFSVRAELPANYPITLQTDSFPPFNMGPNSKGFARGRRRAGNRCRYGARHLPARRHRLQPDPAWPLEPALRTDPAAARPRSVLGGAHAAERRSVQWVGPLAHHDSVLLAPAGKGLKFDSLAQAQGYQIGGHANGTVSLFLESQGIRTSNSLNDAENLRKLLTGRIDLWAVADPVWRYFARQQGVEEGQLQVALSFRSEPLYLALSPDTPDAVVNRLQKALDEVIAEGYAGCSKTPDLCYLIQNRGKTLAGSR